MTPRRHDEAIVQAEIRRLARALAPYRVLPRDTLRRTAGAQRWREGSFEHALTEAVSAGKIRRLGADFYASGEPAGSAGD